MGHPSQAAYIGRSIHLHYQTQFYLVTVVVGYQNQVIADIYVKEICGNRECDVGGVTRGRWPAVIGWSCPEQSGAECAAGSSHVLIITFLPPRDVHSLYIDLLLECRSRGVWNGGRPMGVIGHGK